MEAKIEARVFIGKSLQNTANVPRVHDPRANLILPQFHIVHDDDFETATDDSFNSLPENWREVLGAQNGTDDEKAKLNNKTVSLRLSFNGKNIPSSSAAPSTPVPNVCNTHNAEEDSCATSSSEGDPCSTSAS